MDKGFSISGYLLSRLQPDDPQEARLRMLCVTISKDMPEERRERQLRPFASDMEFMNMIAGWMNGLPEAISHEQPDFARWLELFMTAGEAESTRYVMRLQIWYTHYCCVEELLTLCRLLQRHCEEHLEPSITECSTTSAKREYNAECLPLPSRQKALRYHSNCSMPPTNISTVKSFCKRKNCSVSIPTILSFRK